MSLEQLEDLQQTLLKRNLRILSHLLNKSLMENFIFCVVKIEMQLRKHQTSQYLVSFQICTEISGILKKNRLEKLVSRAYVCVCVCVCVCLRPSTVKASSVWIRWDTRERINDAILKTLNSYADSLYCLFRMENLTFQLAALSCSHTLNGQGHDLTSARLAFRTWGLQLPLADVPFSTHYIVSQSAFRPDTHERFRNLSRKG